jgi:hypothetical protein
LDYYEVLQVDPCAEPEVIEAAYRCLIRKYHPDMRDADERDDPEIQRRTREINEAYDVLRDPVRRAAYDTERQPGRAGSALHLEKREYPARCGRTRQSFLVILARGKGASGPFRVVGIGPVNDDGKKRGDWFRRLVRAFRRGAADVRDPSDLDSKALYELFDESEALDFGNIDWAGYRCPVCRREFVHPDGMRSTWAVCGKCGGVYCTGGIRRTRVGGIASCPWCGTKRQVTYHVRPGAKAHKYVRGRRRTEGDSPALPGNPPRKLPPAG